MIALTHGYLRLGFTLCRSNPLGKNADKKGTEE
jgi:hypothetical protein